MARQCCLHCPRLRGDLRPDCMTGSKCGRSPGNTLPVCADWMCREWEGLP
jgi:hypothetical protein